MGHPRATPTTDTVFEQRSERSPRQNSSVSWTGADLPTDVLAWRDRVEDRPAKESRQDGERDAGAAFADASTSTPPRRALPLPPPPVSPPSVYAHPALLAVTTTPGRRPLPAPPVTSSRWVPPPHPDPPTRGKGKARDNAPRGTPAEEKAAAVARERGLDELFSVEDPSEVATETSDMLSSPAETDLPEYPMAAGPVRGELGRRGTLAKHGRGLVDSQRPGEEEEEEEEEEAERAKRAQAEQEVREQVNREARRTLEEDAAASKAALAAHMEQEERRRAATGQAWRREREVEKLLEEERRLEREPGESAPDAEDEDEDPPPPLSPEAGQQIMLPLGEDKAAFSIATYREGEGPQQPAQAITLYRLPPPPVPLADHAYSVPESIVGLGSDQPSKDYFSQPRSAEGPFGGARSVPLTWPSRPGYTSPDDPVALNIPPPSEFYAGGVAPSTMPRRRYPSSSVTLPGLSSAMRASSLGPPYSFYNHGLSQAVKALDPSLPQRASSFAAPSRVPYGGQGERSKSWSTGPDGSDLRPAGLRSRSTLAPAVSTISDHSQWYPFAAAATDSVRRGAVRTPGSPPSPSSPQPAFYTSLHPGGPLLPFYARNSASPFATAADAGSLQVWPEHTFTPSAAAPRPYGSPTPAAPPETLTYRVQSPLRADSDVSPAGRPSSRSSAGSSPSTGSSVAAMTTQRERRLSTIRGLFGRKGRGEPRSEGYGSGCSGLPRLERIAGD